MENIKHEYQLVSNPQSELNICIIYNFKNDIQEINNIEAEKDVILWQKCKFFLQFVDKLSNYFQKDKCLCFEDIEYQNHQFILKGKKLNENISLTELEEKIQIALESSITRYVESEQICFDESKFLGKGSFGQVQSIQYKNEQYALKIICLCKQKINEEIYIEDQILDYIKEVFYNMQALQIQYIVKLQGYTVLNEDDITLLQVGIMMELMQQSLEKQVSKRRKAKNYFSKEEIQKLITEVKQALIDLKNIGISHRDLSHGNILFSQEGVYKVSDMGTGTFNMNQSLICTLLTGVGKEAYMAPEVQQFFLGESKGNWYSADMYSFAKVILDAGVLKIVVNKERQINQALVEFGERYGEELANEIKKGLDENPISRLKLLNFFA